MAVQLEVFTMKTPTTISSSFTLASGNNYVTAGPITINSGVTIYCYGDWSIV